MINYIVYGHTDYIDILNIQSDYMSGRGKLTLFINQTDAKYDCFNVYDKVVYYDDSKPYASRLLQCFESVEDDYFLFMHDIDILLSVDDNMIENFYSFLRANKFDRIDLKHTYNLSPSLIVKCTDDLQLVKSCDPKDYIYNVNPSIWKRESFVEMLSNFPNETYRSIEFNVQEYCTKYNIFKLNVPTPLHCGWFLCAPIFKFLHVVHLGKILPLNNEFWTPSRQSYRDAKDEYIRMYHKYNMQKINLNYFEG